MVPQNGQNLCPASNCLPQLAQTGAASTFLPQWAQNIAPGTRGAPQSEQNPADASDTGAGVDSVVIAGGNLENTWAEAIKSAKAGGTVSNVNYLSGADNVLIPRVEWGCGMSNINIKNGLCPGGAVRMERLADLALCGRQDPELLVTHKFKGLEKIEDALLLMKDKPKDLIKPVVMLDID